ncbi:hypothetical protein T484DRAFT_1828892 [Baffinella frigidus]|nr:hypothetical protein T484DRAFT_1828892 [Cryptophyta sp. CCMP2293]
MYLAGELARLKGKERRERRVLQRKEFEAKQATARATLEGASSVDAPETGGFGLTPL